MDLICNNPNYGDGRNKGINIRKPKGKILSRIFASCFLVGGGRGVVDDNEKKLCVQNVPKVFHNIPFLAENSPFSEEYFPF